MLFMTKFFFTEAVSDPIATSTNDHRVYAVFSTPDSDVRMSAVCAFSMKRIREEFDYGTFKQQVRTATPTVDEFFE